MGKKKADKVQIQKKLFTVQENFNQVIENLNSKVLGKDLITLKKNEKRVGNNV